MSYEIVIGSLGPTFPLTITGMTLDEDDTVTLRYIDPDGTTHEVEMEITSAADGEVEYTWIDGDLPSVGSYKGQVTVDRAADLSFPRIFPTNGQRVIWWVHTAI